MPSKEWTINFKRKSPLPLDIHTQCNTFMKYSIIKYNILIFNSSSVLNDSIQWSVFSIQCFGWVMATTNLNFWDSQNSRLVDVIACTHKMFELKWMANNGIHRIKRNVCVCEYKFKWKVFCVNWTPNSLKSRLLPLVSIYSSMLLLSKQMEMMMMVMKNIEKSNNVAPQHKNLQLQFRKSFVISLNFKSFFCFPFHLV